MSISEGKYQENDPAYIGSHVYGSPKEYFKLVIKLIESLYNVNEISLIDIGCASGSFIYFAKRTLNIRECVGIDISDLHLKQARENLPDVEFILDSISGMQHVIGRRFDVCTCLGTISIFDNLEDILANLLALVKEGGSLYLFDVVNDFPIDVVMRYRNVDQDEDAQWQSGFNVRSKLTYERLLNKISKNIEVKWVDFEMPFAIPRASDTLRAWTMQTEHTKHQLTVGTGQLLNFKVLHIFKK